MFSCTVATLTGSHTSTASNRVKWMQWKRKWRWMDGGRIFLSLLYRKVPLRSKVLISLYIQYIYSIMDSEAGEEWDRDGWRQKWNQRERGVRREWEKQDKWSDDAVIFLVVKLLWLITCNIFLSSFFLFVMSDCSQQACAWRPFKILKNKKAILHPHIQQ